MKTARILCRDGVYYLCDDNGVLQTPRVVIVPIWSRSGELTFINAAGETVQIVSVGIVRRPDDSSDDE